MLELERPTKRPLGAMTDDFERFLASASPGDHLAKLRRVCRCMDRHGRGADLSNDVSEARQLGVRKSAGVDMQPAEFGTTVKFRKYLPRVEQPIRIEGAFQSLLMLQIGLAEHAAHQVALLDADAMLTGEDAADLHAQLEDVGAERLGALELTRLIGV